jgi:hypothetical protein
MNVNQFTCICIHTHILAVTVITRICIHIHIYITYTYCTYTCRHRHEENPEKIGSCCRTSNGSSVPWEWCVRKAEQMEIKQEGNCILGCDATLSGEWLLTLRRHFPQPLSMYSEDGGSIFVPSLYPENGLVCHGPINCCWSSPARSFLY